MKLTGIHSLFTQNYIDMLEIISVHQCAGNVVCWLFWAHNTLLPILQIYSHKQNLLVETNLNCNFFMSYSKSRKYGGIRLWYYSSPTLKLYLDFSHRSQQNIFPNSIECIRKTIKGSNVGIPPKPSY